MAKDILFKGIPMGIGPSPDGKILLVPKPGTYDALEKPTHSFWHSKQTLAQFKEPDPFAPIPASVYEEAEKNKAAKWAAVHAGYVLQEPAPAPFSGVLVHDCSEHVPYGHGMLTALSWLIGQWKHGMAEVRYIAVGRGDLERLEDAYTTNQTFVSSPSLDYYNHGQFGLFFKGFPVQEHDQRAGYYMLVCY